MGRRISGSLRQLLRALRMYVCLENCRCVHVMSTSQCLKKFSARYSLTLGQITLVSVPENDFSKLFLLQVWKEQKGKTGISTNQPSMLRKLCQSACIAALYITCWRQKHNLAIWGRQKILMPQRWGNTLTFSGQQQQFIFLQQNQYSHHQEET